MKDSVLNINMEVVLQNDKGRHKYTFRDESKNLVKIKQEEWTSPEYKINATHKDDRESYDEIKETKRALAEMTDNDFSKIIKVKVYCNDDEFTTILV